MARLWRTSNARSNEICEALRSLKPAEQLAGYDEAIRNLGAKLDTIVRSQRRPRDGPPARKRHRRASLHRLQRRLHRRAGAAQRRRAHAFVQGRPARPHRRPSRLLRRARAAHRRPDLIAGKPRAAAASENSEQLEGALRGLSDRLDRMPVANDSASAFAHLEQRVSYLLERLEASADHRAGNLGRVEDGLQDILRHLEAQHASFAALTESRGPRTRARAWTAALPNSSSANCPISASSRPETDRQTQVSLEAVHNSLGHVVDRLAMIEGDLRNAARPPVPAARAGRALGLRGLSHAGRRGDPAAPSRNCRNPAAAEPHFSAAAPRDFHAARRSRAAIKPPRAISEILEPQAAPPRAAIEPDLPPDHPLEPGTRPPGGRLRRRNASPPRKAPSARSRQARASRPAHRVSSPRHAARRRPPRPHRRPTSLAHPLKGAEPGVRPAVS